jgi:hypothetical protein
MIGGIMIRCDVHHTHVCRCLDEKIDKLESELARYKKALEMDVEELACKMRPEYTDDERHFNGTEEICCNVLEYLNRIARGEK